MKDPGAKTIWLKKTIEEPEESSNGGKLNKGVHMELTELDKVLC